MANSCLAVSYSCIAHGLIPYENLGELIVRLFTAETSLRRVISFMNKSIKLHVYAVVAAGLALSPIIAHAQTSPTGNARRTTTTSDATADARGDRNDRHNYGWIGLAGLLGLAGLMGRKRDDRYGTASTGSRRVDLAGTRS
jgi:hypothetical protein